MPFDFVLYSLRSPLDRANLLAAARAAALAAEEWMGDGERYATLRELRAAAIIWDLDDGNPARLSTLHDLRARRPALPVLLLLPVRPGAMSLAAEAGCIPNVEVRGIWPGPASQEALRRFLQSARDSAPRHRAIEEVVGPATGPPPILIPFAQAVLERRCRDQSMTVGHVADDLGLTLRRLRLRWPGPPCPSPSEMMAWAEMILYAVIAAADGRPPTRIARSFGHTEKSFARLRQRLGLPPLGTQEPAVALAVVRSAYRARWQRRSVARATAS